MLCAGAGDSQNDKQDWAVCKVGEQRKKSLITSMNQGNAEVEGGP